MTQRLLTRRSLLFSLAGILVTAMLSIWGCGSGGGTSSYADLSPTTTRSSAIIDAATLKQWIDEGKLNAPYGSKDRVVVITPTTQTSYISKKHIPGASLLDTGADLYATRLEGLASVGSMVQTGTQMDALVSKVGIDSNTTIVISLPKGSTDSEHYAQSRTFWSFRYWGFARERIKLLNGGDDAWEFAGNTLTDIPYVASPSGYSVKSNKTLKSVVRYSINEIIQKVDELVSTPSQLENWQLVEARGDGTTLYMKNALRTYNTRTGETSADAMMFLANRVNGEATRNRLYPDKASLLNLMATMPMDKDGERTATFLSPTKKTIVMCGSAISASPSFVLFDAVLAVPEGNIAMYDGSSTQWNTYSRARITNYNAKPATMDQTEYDALIANWSFDQRVNGAMPAFVAASDTTPFNTFNALTYTPALSDLNAVGIKAADQTYMLSAPPVSTGGGSGGSSGGGC